LTLIFDVDENVGMINFARFRLAGC
jgi:hypothetical protein